MAVSKYNVKLFICIISLASLFTITLYEKYTAMFKQECCMKVLLLALKK